MAAGTDVTAAHLLRVYDRIPMAAALAAVIAAVFGSLWKPLGTFLLCGPRFAAVILPAPIAIARATGG